MLPADAELVTRCRSGDEGAFSMLVERYQNRAFRTAFGMLRDREDALEVAQDAFVRAYRSLATFRGEAEFSTWLHRIVTNLARNRIRYRRRRRHDWKVSIDADPESGGYSAVPEIADLADDPAERVATRDMTVYVQNAMKDLPAVMREVLCLRDIEGLSYAEIAVLSGCEIGTVKSRIFRAREALRVAVFQDEDGL